MASASLSRALSYPGWKAVAVAFTLLFFVFGGPVGTMPLIYGEVIKEFGWTRSQATLAYTSALWIGAATSIFVLGPLLQKLGLRTILIASIVMSSLGMLCFLIVHSMWTYYLAFLLMILGYGWCMTGVHILMLRWYTRNLGLAVGVGLTGSSVAGIIMPLACAWLTSHFGWRAAEGLIGTSIVIVGLPVYLLLGRDNPTEEELVPEAVKTAPNPQMAERIRKADLGLSFAQVLKMPMFWIVIAGITLIQGIDSGMYQHTALYLENEKGLGREMAAASLSGLFAISILSKVLAGTFFDRFSIRGVQIWWLLLAGVVALAFPVQGGISLLIFTLARGLVHGGLITEGTILAKHCFGPKVMDRLFPVMVGFVSLGGGGGAWVISAMVDHFGRYREAFILLIVAAIFASAMLFFVKPLYRDRLRAALMDQEGDDAAPLAAEPT